MAISNCLFSSTSKNPIRFSVWCVIAKLSAKPRNELYTNLLVLIDAPKSI
jgi:hypothetical protein